MSKLRPLKVWRITTPNVTQDLIYCANIGAPKPVRRKVGQVALIEDYAEVPPNTPSRIKNPKFPTVGDVVTTYCGMRVQIRSVKRVTTRHALATETRKAEKNRSLALELISDF